MPVQLFLARVFEPVLNAQASALCRCNFSSPASSHLCSNLKPVLYAGAIFPHLKPVLYAGATLPRPCVFEPVLNPQACALRRCNFTSPVSSNLCSTLKPVLYSSATFPHLKPVLYASATFPHLKTVLYAGATFPRPCLRTCAQRSSLCFMPVQLYLARVSSDLCSTLKPVLYAGATFPHLKLVLYAGATFPHLKPVLYAGATFPRPCVFGPVLNPQACALRRCNFSSPVSSHLCSTLKPVLYAGATFPHIKPVLYASATFPHLKPVLYAGATSWVSTRTTSH
jgi:hypothetical protein